MTSTIQPQFKIDDRVTLVNDPNKVGTITNIQTYKSFYPDYEVRWDWDESDWYDEGNLRLHNPGPVTMVTNLIQAFNQRRKISAIKEIRALTGLGLKEAKDLAETYNFNPTPTHTHTITLENIRDLFTFIRSQKGFSACVLVSEFTGANYDDAQDLVDELISDFTPATPTTPATFIKVGDRVKRGPTWEWGDQDEDGLGTVIDVDTPKGWVMVKWDHGGRNDYRMPTPNHPDSEYRDLEIVSSDPTPTTFIKVGDRVKRGPTWKWGDQDRNGLGTVTKLNTSDEWVTVEWDHGRSDSYRMPTPNWPDCPHQDLEIVSSDPAPTPTPTLTVKQAVAIYMAQSVNHMAKVTGFRQDELYDEIMDQRAWRSESLPEDETMMIDVISWKDDIPQSTRIAAGHVNPNLPEGFEWRPHLEDHRY